MPTGRKWKVLSNASSKVRIEESGERKGGATAAEERRQRMTSLPSVCLGANKRLLIAKAQAQTRLRQGKVRELERGSRNDG